MDLLLSLKGKLHNKTLESCLSIICGDSHGGPYSIIGQSFPFYLLYILYNSLDFPLFLNVFCFPNFISFLLFRWCQD